MLITAFFSHSIRTNTNFLLNEMEAIEDYILNGITIESSEKEINRKTIIGQNFAMTKYLSLH